MRFHRNCGENVKLSKNNYCAERTGDSYDNGIVYSERPIAIGEIFQLKITKVITRILNSEIRHRLLFETGTYVRMLNNLLHLLN